MSAMMILKILLFLFLVGCLLMLIIPYIKRTRIDDFSKIDQLVDPEKYWFGENYTSGNRIYAEKTKINKVILLPSASSIIHQMYTIISGAQKSIILSTYRWRVEPKDGKVNGQILAIGYALAELSNRCKLEKKNVSFMILCNQMLLGSESNGWVTTQLMKTLACWFDIGFQPVANEEEFGVYIDFRTWPHITLGNIHSKFLIVDNLQVATYSLNIEGYSHGKDGSWKECGVCFHSPEYATHITQYFHDLWSNHTTKFNMFELFTRLKPFYFEEELKDVTFNFKNYEINEPQDNISCLVLTSIPRPFALDRSNAIMSALVPILKNAKKSIYITTPNLNDPVIVSILQTKITEKLDVAVVLDKGFNIDVPYIQAALLGWSTNEQQVSTWYANGLANYMRWNGNSGYVITGKVDHQLHGKTFLIDDEICVIGSLNADVYSTISSAEIITILFSKELGLSLKNQFFNPIWCQSVPIK